MVIAYKYARPEPGGGIRLRFADVPIDAGRIAVDGGSKKQYFLSCVGGQVSALIGGDSYFLYCIARVKAEDFFSGRNIYPECRSHRFNGGPGLVFLSSYLRGSAGAVQVANDGGGGFELLFFGRHDQNLLW